MELAQIDGIHTFHDETESFSKIIDLISKIKYGNTVKYSQIVLILKVYSVYVCSTGTVLDLLFLSKVVLNCSGIGISSNDSSPGIKMFIESVLELTTWKPADRDSIET